MPDKYRELLSRHENIEMTNEGLEKPKDEESTDEIKQSDESGDLYKDAEEVFDLKTDGDAEKDS